MLIAMGYNAKEWVILFVPGFILFTALTHFTEPAWWRWRRVGLVILGAGSWTGAEILVAWRWMGDPLFHPHAVQESLRIGGQVVNLDPRSLVIYWSEYIRWMADPASETGLVGPVLLVSMAAACIWRSPRTNLLLCCLLPTLAYLSVGSSELRAYFPVCHQHRYLVPLIPGMVMIAGLMIARWMGSRRFERWAAIGPLRRLTAGACVASLLASLVTPARFADQWYHAATFAAGLPLLRQLKVLPKDSVWASGLSCNRFRGTAEWLGLPRIETISCMPHSAEEWQSRYPGRFVLVTARDRQAATSPKHRDLVLSGDAYAGLATFPRIISRASVGVSLTPWGFPSASSVDPSNTVELYRIPPDVVSSGG